MATRARDTVPPGKEKRGTSPSHPITHHLRSPDSSKTNSPVRKQADSITSNKNVPNYLKPTFSSSNDSNIHKRVILSRGRSFDRPPVSALQKPRTSPNPKDRILRSSSSFSGKISSTSQKPISEKLSRPSHLKDATGKRGTSLNSRPMTIKKTTTTGTTGKKEDGSNDMHNARNDQAGDNGSSSKASMVTGSPHEAEDVIPQTETGQDNMDTLRNEDGQNDSAPKASIITNTPHEVEDVIPQTETGQDNMHKLRNDQDGHNDSAPKASILNNIAHEVEDAIPRAEPSQEDDQELPGSEIGKDMITNNSEIVATDTEEDSSAVEDQEELNENGNNVEIEDLKVREYSILVEKQEITTMEEEPPKLLVEDISTSSQKEPEEITNEPGELQLEENPIKAVDENQKEKEEDEGRKQGKDTVVEEESVQGSKITVASSKPQRQLVHGKKESTVSNDVIEETASKLREQRKNRVKALAGAFETVISLQEPKT